MNAVRASKLICAGVAVCVLMAGCSGSKDRVDNRTLSDHDTNTYSVQNSLKPKVLYRASAEKRLDILEEQLIKDFNIEGTQTYYYYNFADLNDDQSNELLVYLKRMSQDNDAILSQQLIIYDTAYKQLLLSTEISTPIVILNQRHNGWLDLAVYESNGQYRRISMSEKGYVLGEKSNENVINFDELDGVCYLSNIKNENGFLIK